MKIFGRDPALLYTLVSSIIMLGSLTVGLTDGQQGALNGAVLFLGGLWLSWKVSHEKAVAALSGAAKAVFAVILAFGGHITSGTQVVVMSAVSAAVSFWLYGKVVAPIDAYGNEVPKDLEDHVAG